MRTMRRIVSVTGTRADYGLMEPVHRAIAAHAGFELHLIVTGMHHEPEFADSLARVRSDRLGQLHDTIPRPDDDSGRSMARAIGDAIGATADVFDRVGPDIVLLQGDRGEMLAAAIAAAHMNLPIVHMSGGDFSGSIDDSVRNALSKLAHVHLTSCAASTDRLVGLGEDPRRIMEVGEPALDLLRTMQPVPIETLAAELDLPAREPFLVATLHPVTNEAERAGDQMRVMLDALAEIAMPAVVTYPNSDAGGRAMRAVLDSRRGCPFLRVVPSLGSHRYLSLIRHAAALVGNSSSGIIEAPALKVPVVDIGSRQAGRLRAANVVNAACERTEIVRAVRFVLEDSDFRDRLAGCASPYGDGHTAERVVAILLRLRLGGALIAKWLPSAGPFLADQGDGL